MPEALDTRVFMDRKAGTNDSFFKIELHLGVGMN